LFYWELSDVLFGITSIPDIQPRKLKRVSARPSERKALTPTVNQTGTF
jgi:hypothetical protein